MQYNVCSYNIGSNAGDYLRLCNHLYANFKISSREEEQKFKQEYDAAQATTAKTVGDQAAVFCLQEVGSEDRPLIKSFIEKEFEIVHLNGNPSFDTAIALDKKRFTNITNHSFDALIAKNYKKDVAIATATDILTGQQVTFVSAHIQGFDFSDINQQTTVEGDLQCRLIAQKVAEVSKGTLQVIGADMNANPEVWGARFHLLTSQGYDIQRNNSGTNVNPSAESHKEREIDFIFTRTTTSLWQRIKSFFFSSLVTNREIYNCSLLSWDRKLNASDHLPVFVTIRPEFQPSTICKILNGFWNLFFSAPVQQRA